MGVYAAVVAAVLAASACGVPSSGEVSPALLWNELNTIVGALAIRPGDHVADLGAGSGSYVFALARATGPQGRVYAVDIDPASTAFIRRRAAKRGYRQIRTVLATADDPMLPEDGVDLIFTANTYHHIDNRVAYFTRVRAALRPRGHVAVIDYSPDNWLYRDSEHTIERETIVSEMRTAGYRLIADYDLLEYQSFLLFTPTFDLEYEPLPG